MREDLSRIIASLINNVPRTPIISETCEGLDVLKENWPGLTETEKQEIVAIILSLKKIETEVEKEASKGLW